MAKNLLFLPILLLLVCCTQSKKALQKLEQTAKEVTTGLQPTLEDAAKKADPDYQLSEKEEGLVSSSNAFSLKLFQLLADKKGKESVALSPMAVIYSLNMLNNGANGKTQAVISKALGYTADDLDDINSLNRTMLIGQRKGGIDEQNDSSGYMITANFLILNGQTKLLPDFQEVLEHDYFTNIIDNANTPKGKGRANKLCKTITKGDITNLPINLTGPRAAQLFNAVTLKTAWSLPFYKELTKSMPFHCEDGRTRQVRMMMNDDTMQMYQGYNAKDYQVLLMPLQNGFRLYAILPLKKVNLQDVIRKLTVKELRKIAQTTKTYDNVNILFPCFSTSSNIPLKQLYGDMGLANLFSHEADFSRMSAQPLAVDDVFQQINLNVNEDGISAKAIQVTHIAYLSANDNTSSFSFKADHPFLYYVLDRYNNLCFMGTYMGD